ncbi:MAG: GNAT family N-acetyltransferase [Chloroflexota bacterium]|nr:GNAT family N-acetyltransferase [Chloroflexota bacterium]
MAIQLRKISHDNLFESIGLSTSDDQKHFVATNVVSIAQAYVEPTWMPLAIYADDTMVGFVMYGHEPKTGFDRIIRLMIDLRYQGRGYGRATMIELLARLKQAPDFKDIKISYEPENHTAERLYTQLGFRPTGEIEAGEVIAQLQTEQ